MPRLATNDLCKPEHFFGRELRQFVENSRCDSGWRPLLQGKQTDALVALWFFVWRVSSVAKKDRIRSLQRRGPLSLFLKSLPLLIRVVHKIMPALLFPVWGFDFKPCSNYRVKHIDITSLSKPDNRADSISDTPTAGKEKTTANDEGHLPSSAAEQKLSCYTPGTSKMNSKTRWPMCMNCLTP